MGQYMDMVTMDTDMVITDTMGMDTMDTMGTMVTMVTTVTTDMVPTDMAVKIVMCVAMFTRGKK